MKRITSVTSAFRFILLFMVLVLTACSESNSDGPDLESAGASTEQPGTESNQNENSDTRPADDSNIDTAPQAGAETAPVRLKNLSVDLARDGTTDEIWTYNYDSEGRIISREVSTMNNPLGNYTVTYTYQGNKLVSKLSSMGEEDTHVYNNAGQLISSDRYRSGLHKYGYDDDGRLISAQLLDLIQDCSDPATFGTSSTELSLKYEGDRLSGITRSDGYNPIEITYTEQGQISLYSEGCGEASKHETLFSYNGAGQLIKSEDLDFSPGYPDESITTITTRRLLVFNYNDRGLIESDVDTEFNRITTATYTHTPEGHRLTEDVVRTDRINPTLEPDGYTITYEYEDASCQIAMSSNPTKLLLPNEYFLVRNYNSPLNCIYQMDDSEF